MKTRELLSSPSAELDVGRIHPWVGLGRDGLVGLGHKILRLGWVELGLVRCEKYIINIKLICKKFVV